MRPFLIILLLLPYYIFSEVEVGSISALIYEYYQEPVELDYENNPISKPMVSITPQLIWKDGRNMLLLNLELLGALGSLEGSFGKDGSLSGQLKADSFYIGYIPDTNIFLKFGKYSADIPHGFPVRVMTGQIESGIRDDKYLVFSSLIFYNIFNIENEDGSFSFNNERYNDDNKFILNTGLNISGLGLNLRVPIEFNRNYSPVSLHPSLSFTKDFKTINNNSFLGISIRDFNYIIGIREELTLRYSFLSSALLFSYLSTNGNREENYNFTSIDNKDLDFHYGSHFNYLYQECANVYGMTTIGFKETLIKNQFDIWAGYSGHFAIDNFESELRDNSYIASIISLGLKKHNLWSDNTLLEIYSSLLIPGGFSAIEGEQTRDLGFQLVLKLQHIIF